MTSSAGRPRPPPAAAGRPCSRATILAARLLAPWHGRARRHASPATRRGEGRGPDGPARCRARSPRHHALPAGDHPGARGAGRARLRRQQGLGRRRRPGRWPSAGSSCSPGRRAGSARSSGQIALNSPDHEVADARALVDWLAARPEVLQDGPGDPRVGVTGALVRRGAGAAAGRVRPARRRARPGDHLERPAARRCSRTPRPHAPAPPADTPAPRRLRPGRGVQAGWAGVFFSAGLAPDARDPSTDRAGGSGRRDAEPLQPHRALPPAPRHLRPLHRRGLRRLHRGRHHRPALPGDRGAAAPLVAGHGDRPDHRADAAGAGRAGHAVRPRPGRRERPPDRRRRRPR